MPNNTKQVTSRRDLPIEIIEQILQELLLTSWRTFETRTISRCRCSCLSWLDDCRGVLCAAEGKEFPYRGSFVRQVLSIFRVSRTFFVQVYRFLRDTAKEVLMLQARAHRTCKIRLGADEYKSAKDELLPLDDASCINYSHWARRETFWEVQAAIFAADQLSVGFLEGALYQGRQMRLPSRRKVKRHYESRLKPYRGKTRTIEEMFGETS